MRKERIREKIEAALTGNPDKLDSLARDIGFELPRCRLDVLNEFLAEASRNPGRPSAFAEGFFCALLAVVRSFETCLNELEQDKELLNLIKIHNVGPLLLAIHNDPRKFKYLADLEKEFAVVYGTPENVRNIIGRLCNVYLVEQRGDPPFCGLTLKGEKIAEILKKVN